MGKWYVEWEFVETPFGMRPMWIKFFNTEEEADEFCKYKTDAKRAKWNGKMYIITGLIDSAPFFYAHLFFLIFKNEFFLTLKSSFS